MVKFYLSDSDGKNCSKYTDNNRAAIRGIKNPFLSIQSSSLVGIYKNDFAPFQIPLQNT